MGSLARQRALLSVVIGVAAVCANLQTQAATAPVGAIPGSLVVGETGAATYTIPIAVPPGIAGMEPRLTLAYSSQAGNGMLGVGWSLGGLSAITRCPATYAQDGFRGGINLDGNDRYCLDGQRLVAISGAYGADNTEYRTETESYSRVISYGASGSGPANWKVWTKSGLVMEYATDGKAKIQAGSGGILVWFLNKVTDTSSNYLTVTYTRDTTNNQTYPTRIDYTGNGTKAQAPTNSVRLAYEARSDIPPAYQAGVKLQNTVRLKTLSTYVGSSKVMDYKLTYKNTATST